MLTSCWTLLRNVVVKLWIIK